MQCLVRALQCTIPPRTRFALDASDQIAFCESLGDESRRPSLDLSVFVVGLLEVEQQISNIKGNILQPLEFWNLSNYGGGGSKVLPDPRQSAGQPTKSCTNCL